jgi:hypothetical protein
MYYYYNWKLFPLMKIYYYYYKTIELFSRIPVTSCSFERNFFKLNSVKSKLRPSMNQEAF